MDAQILEPDAQAAEDEWQELDGSGSGDGVSDAPTANAGHAVLGISPMGAVHVLYSTDETGTSAVYLKRWSGTGWEGVGASADPGGLSDSAIESTPGTVSFGTDNAPHVAWMNFDGARSIHYRHYDGTSWVERAGSATARGVSGEANPWWPSVAIADSGQPYIAYETYNVIASGGAIHLKTEAAGSWQGVADSDQAEGLSDANSNSQLTRMALDGDDIYVVWQEDRAEGVNIYASHFSPDTGWAAIGTSLSPGGISQSGNRSERPTIRVRDGEIVVSWTEELPEGRRAYLKRFDGSDWVAMADSASNDGLGAAGAEADAVHIALRPNGKPVAIWSQTAGGVADIHAAYWHGSGWAPLGPGLGNVSDTANNSVFPTIEVAETGEVYAAWIEHVEEGRNAIYMRAFPSE